MNQDRPQHPHGEDDRLLTIQEVSELTRVCVATLRWMRHTSTGPRSFKPARRVLHWHSDVLAWIDRHYDDDGPRVA
jgi:predicted DNA-binding transcriptional regulator AlpA